MKLRSEATYELNENSLRADKKKKFSAIKERREIIKKRAEATLQIETDQKQSKELRIILTRLERGDVKVNPTTIEEYRKIVKEGLSRKMTEHVKTVDPLKLDGNLGENWRKFKRNYDIFALAAGLNLKEDVVKINTLLNAIGPEAVEMYDTFDLTSIERGTYATVTKAFADFCSARKNTVYERYKFYQRDQKEGESFDAFLMDIKILVRSCEFTDNQSEMLRDRIVMGINDKKVQTKLLETPNLSYDIAVEKSRTSEATREQQQNMCKSTEINELNSAQVAAHANNSKNYKSNNNNNKNSKMNTNERRTPHKRQAEKHTQHRSNDRGNRNDNNRNDNSRNEHNRNSNRAKCQRCNFNHRFKECPAYGKTCNACSKPNHFASVCKSRNINCIENDYDEFYVGSVETKCTSGTYDAIDSTRWFERVRIQNLDVAFKIDTGAEMNVLPLHVYRRLNLNVELQPAKITLRAFGGQQIAPMGMCSLPCNYKNVSLRVVFAIVDLGVIPILGLATCTRLNIVNPPRSQNEINTINRYNL